MESLCYVGPSTRNKLLNNLKTTNGVNCFKHDVKIYFYKIYFIYVKIKSSETEANIFILTFKKKTLRVSA